MKILLATGIYQPDIGGPATYVANLTRELTSMGYEVVVVTYVDFGLRLPAGQAGTSDFGSPSSVLCPLSDVLCTWPVVHVPQWGGPLVRWWRYAKALRRHGADADIVYAFSSVSCGVPLWLSALRRPKRVLRLGGDFLWERYTDHGGNLALRAWYEQRGGSCFVARSSFLVARSVMGWILRTFDHIVFSTRMQEELYERMYCRLPSHSVIENAVPFFQSCHSLVNGRMPVLHERHDPFRLLFMGRFVGFKNLPALVRAAGMMPHVTLTLVGEGPMHRKLSAISYQLSAPVRFLPPVHGADRQCIFTDHDLLVLPSLTEISPNVALEARAAGLPVLLTEETGLSSSLREGMVVRPLRTARELAGALLDSMSHYGDIAFSAAAPPPHRRWSNVVGEHNALFRSLCSML